MQQPVMPAELYLLIGGEDNIGFCRRKDRQVYLSLKDKSLCQQDALAAQDSVESCVYRNGQLVITLAQKEEGPAGGKGEALQEAAREGDALADAILRQVGGRQNIEGLAHCITRLRFRLRDEGQADLEALKKTGGILRVIRAGGQLQIVIGNDVEAVYDALCERTGLLAEAGKEQQARANGIFDALMDTISGVLAPTLSVLTAAGIIKGVLSLCATLGYLRPDGGLYMVLYAAGDGFFYFLPLILGYTAAKKFKCNEFLGLAIGGALCYPAMVDIATSHTAAGTILAGTPFEMSYYNTFLGIPVVMPGSGYPSSVVPVILAVWLAAALERACKRRLPAMIRGLLTPVLVLVIVIPATYLAIGPVSMVLCGALSLLIDLLYGIPVVGGAVGGCIIGGAWSVLVMLGLHWAGLSVSISNLAVTGFDYILVASCIGPFVGMAQGLAILMRSRSRKVRDLALPATISQICGVGEPLMYSIMIPLKKPFLINIIGSAVGGMLLGMSGAKAYLMGGLGLFCFPNYIDPATGDLSGMRRVIACVVITMVLSFFLQFFNYSDEQAGNLE